MPPRPTQDESGAMPVVQVVGFRIEGEGGSPDNSASSLAATSSAALGSFLGGPDGVQQHRVSRQSSQSGMFPDDFASVPAAATPAMPGTWQRTQSVPVQQAGVTTTSSRVPCDTLPGLAHTTSIPHADELPEPEAPQHAPPVGSVARSALLPPAPAPVHASFNDAGASAPPPAEASGAAAAQPDAVGHARAVTLSSYFAADAEAEPSASAAPQARTSTSVCCMPPLARAPSSSGLRSAGSAVLGTAAASAAASAAAGGSEAGDRPAKVVLTKAERRALQDAQRAKKAAAKTSGGPSGGKPAQPKAEKLTTRASSRGQDLPTYSEGRAGAGDAGKGPEGRHSAIGVEDKQHSSVGLRPLELFDHLPSYKHMDSDIALKMHGKVHPAVLQTGLGYADGSIRGSTARSVAMMLALRAALAEYVTPDDKAFSRAATSYINTCVAFLWDDCRPACVSQRNSVKWLKKALVKLPHEMPEAEAKESILRQIDDFVHERFVLADQVLAAAAGSKIDDGDVIMTYGHSSVVLNILLKALADGKQFEVVCVDGRPHFDGEVLCKALLARGVRCTYIHLNAIAFVMDTVTKVLLGASAVKSNGAVVARSGTAVVAMAAHVARKPVLICAQSIKFHEAVQLDSITSNEQGNPRDMLEVRGRKAVSASLKELSRDNKLNVLNLVYDVMPMEFITLIVTEFGLIPATSVPVILREKRDDDMA